MVATMVGWMDEKMASAEVGWMAAGTAAGWVASKVSSTVAAMGVGWVVETVVVLAARMAVLKAERKAVQMEQWMVAATDSAKVAKLVA